MFYKIKSVKAVENGILYITFTNDIVKIYNMKLLANKNPKFEAVIDDEIFCTVRVDEGGSGIAWDGFHELSSEEIWANGATVLQ